MLWPNDPVVGSCGCLYCKLCAESMRKTYDPAFITVCPNAVCNSNSRLHPAPNGLADILINTTLPCPSQCGELVNPRFFNVHEDFDCMNTMVNCAFCDNKFPRRDVNIHENICATKWSKFCSTCHFGMENRLFRNHCCLDLTQKHREMLLLEGSCLAADVAVNGISESGIGLNKWIFRSLRWLLIVSERLLVVKQ